MGEWWPSRSSCGRSILRSAFQSSWSRVLRSGMRAPRFTLLLSVDEVTGDVPHALFRPAEDARGYFT